MSTPRRNRQQRFVRAVVYILVLALVIGLIATMVGTAFASPARAAEGMAGPAASIASPASSASSALAASVVPAASAAPEAMADQPAAPDQPTAPDDGRPSVVVLGTVDLTWADLLAAADSDDAPLAAAARTILTYAGGGEPVDLVTRTVGDGTCPADGWLTLGAGSRLRAAERFGLDPGLPTLLVTGGSLGALHLNDVLTSGLPAIRRAGVQILHLTGRGKDGAVRAALREAGGYGRYRVVDYLRGMEEAYAAADLVLCRSGAGTVAELCALGLPGFFVPLPIGNGEQERNAADVVAAGGAALVRDRDFDLTAFERDVLPLVGDAARLEAMAAASRGLGHVDAAERLADLAVRIGGEKG